MYKVLNSSAIDMMYYFGNPDSLFKDKKNKRKVSKYKDKKGEIKKQIDYCIKWLNEESKKYIETCKIISCKRIFKIVRAKGGGIKSYKYIKREFIAFSKKNSNSSASDYIDEFMLLKFVQSDFKKAIRSNEYKIEKLKTVKMKLGYSDFLSSPIACYVSKYDYKTAQEEFIEIPVSVYRKREVARFLLILDYALKEDMIKEILDIPDVFYILRQIICIGPEYYFE